MSRTAVAAPTPGARLRRLVRRRDEEGQALILALIVMLIVVMLAPIILSQVTSEANSTAENVNFEAALSAAEAGLQQYRNYLDIETNYWEYTPATAPAYDLAMQPNGWQTIAGTSPPEAFHYLPNKNALPTGPGAGTAAILLTVTGRAGTPGHYAYRTIESTFEANGLLTDAYFSQYEVVDQAQDTAVANVDDNGTKTSVTPNDVTLPAAVPSVSGTTTNLWVALCQYDTWEPNSFIDGLGTSVANGGSGGTAEGNPYAGGSYSSSKPYYGPWRGNEPNSGSNDNTFSYTSGSWSVSVVDPCGSPHNFEGGETFNGPVYSDDQLWICNPGGDFGTGPTFNDGIEVGNMPQGGFPYAYTQWPAQPAYSNPGHPGWLDNGELDWDNSCGGGASEDYSFGSKGVTGVTQIQPENVDTALLSQAEVAGCVYTGPTMIQFTGGGNFTVWSPESAGTTTSYGGASCGTFSSASEAGAIQNESIPSTGLLIYVNNAPSTASVPSVTPFEGSALPSSGSFNSTWPACLNPWKPYAPASSPITQDTCGVVSREGDAIVEGEVQGQVTIAAEANIVVSRDLTYECADQALGGVSGQEGITALPSACYTESVPDVLGLIANQDVIIAHPAEGTLPPSSQSCQPGQSAPSGFASCVSDDYVPFQTEPYEWPSSSASPWCADDGTESGQTIANVVPDCQVDNPVIDAALVALGGSFAIEDWDMGQDLCSHGCSSNGAYVLGTDIGEFRGPFGCTSGAEYCDGLNPNQDGDYSYGYDKNFSYDTRLSYLTPPDMNLVAGLTWDTSNFVTCGSVDDIAVTNPSAAGICPTISGITNH